MLEYVTVRLRADLLSPLGRFLQDHAHFPTPLRHISVPSAAWRGHSGRCAGPHRVSWSAACVHCACTPGQGRAWPCCYCMGTAAHTWKWAPVSGSPRELAGWGATLHRVTQTNHSQQAQCPNRLHTRAFTHIPSLTHTHTHAPIYTHYIDTHNIDTRTHTTTYTHNIDTHMTRVHTTHTCTRARRWCWAPPTAGARLWPKHDTQPPVSSTQDAAQRRHCAARRRRRRVARRPVASCRRR